MEAPFDIEYKGVPARVQEHEGRVFTIKFSDNRKPLAITVSVLPDKTKWWTSIPQGRQSEAEEVGKLIAAYIRVKKKERQ